MAQNNGNFLDAEALQRQEQLEMYQEDRASAQRICGQLPQLIQQGSHTYYTWRLYYS